ncbi:MAG: hypothetical protein JW787_08500 [Sedimentisphaerales bacterium]|nr:hypothetical protein [Sedimentisphaerales bacterium]
MAVRKLKFGIFVIFIAALGYGIAVLFSRSPYKAAVMTIHELLTENKELKQAITNLTQEEQIGYAKIISQEEKEGLLYTTIKFVETARGNNLNKIIEKEYTIEGDTFFFDVMIVKFGNKMVTDGKAKALYLWRRIFGEKMAPERGYVIEEPGTEPIRYKDLLKALPVEHCELFWSNIWDLANDPNRLKEYDIQAIYGEALYYKLIKGRVYIFKITPAGQVYPEAIPDI